MTTAFLKRSNRLISNALPRLITHRANGTLQVHAAHGTEPCPEKINRSDVKFSVHHGQLQRAVHITICTYLFFANFQLNLVEIVEITDGIYF